MKYVDSSYLGCSGYVYWLRGGPEGKWKPAVLYCDLQSKRWPMTLAHELGHCLSILVKPNLANFALNSFAVPHSLGPTKDDLKKRFAKGEPLTRRRLFGYELLAWRLAKTFLSPSLWDEDFALRSLGLGQVEGFPSKLRIIEYRKEKWNSRVIKQS